MMLYYYIYNYFDKIKSINDDFNELIMNYFYELINNK